MDINKLAETLISDHRNPIVKVDFTKQKLLIPKNAIEEKIRVQESLNSLQKSINVHRVEKRHTRSKAIWLPDKHLAQVKKIIGNLPQHYGYQNKNGFFLHPEEALFLLEMNRLEIFWNGLTLGIQQAYMVVLEKSEYSLEKYLTYKKFVLLGSLVNRVNKTKYQSQSPIAKRKCPQHVNTEIIFADIKNQGPKINHIILEEDPAFGLQLSDSLQKCNKSNFNIYISSDKTMNSNLGWKDETVMSSITSISNLHPVSCYKFSAVNLPQLPSQ